MNIACLALFALGASQHELNVLLSAAKANTSGSYPNPHCNPTGKQPLPIQRPSNHVIAAHHESAVCQ